MADTITQKTDGVTLSGYAPSTKTTPVWETLHVTLEGADAVIYCNHTTAASINTRLVREAISVIATPADSATANASDVLQAGAVIESDAGKPGAKVTLYGVTAGTYHVLIIGKA